MHDNFTESYFLSLIDDAERIVLSDPAGETIPFSEYTVKAKREEVQNKEDVLASIYKEAESCHSCSGYMQRSVFASPIVKSNAKVLFIAPYPEGTLIFSPESLQIFRAWWKLSLLLEEGEWALTTLIKCPAGKFSSESADMCRAYLRTEMAEMKPEAIVLMGEETARYMLRKNLPMNMLRQRRFVVNHIPVVVTYTPADYISDPSLKKPIWQDMLFIRKSIGTEERKA